jgi:hypothetical protein
MNFPQQAELEAFAKKVPEGLSKEDLDKLVKLSAAKIKWQDERDAEIVGIIDSIKENKIELIRLIGKAYSVEELKSAATHFDLIKTGASNKKKSTSQGKLVVGTFKLSDYGFIVEKQTDGTVPTEYEWDFNNNPRGVSWKQRFVQAIISKGIDDCMTKITPEFKAWLEISRKDARSEGKLIFENKAAFYKAFGLKGDGTPSKSNKPA